MGWRALGQRAEDDDRDSSCCREGADREKHRLERRAGFAIRVAEDESEFGEQPGAARGSALEREFDRRGAQFAMAEHSRNQFGEAGVFRMTQDRLDLDRFAVVLVVRGILTMQEFGRQHAEPRGVSLGIAHPAEVFKRERAAARGDEENVGRVERRNRQARSLATAEGGVDFPRRDETRQERDPGAGSVQNLLETDAVGGRLGENPAAPKFPGIGDWQDWAPGFRLLEKALGLIVEACQGFPGDLCGRQNVKDDGMAAKFVVGGNDRGPAGITAVGAEGVVAGQLFFGTHPGQAAAFVRQAAEDAERAGGNFFVAEPLVAGVDQVAKPVEMENPLLDVAVKDLLEEL